MRVHLRCVKWEKTLPFYKLIGERVSLHGLIELNQNKFFRGYKAIDVALMLWKCFAIDTAIDALKTFAINTPIDANLELWLRYNTKLKLQRKQETKQNSHEKMEKRKAFSKYV